MNVWAHTKCSFLTTAEKHCLMIDILNCLIDNLSQTDIYADVMGKQVELPNGDEV